MNSKEDKLVIEPFTDKEQHAWIEMWGEHREPLPSTGGFQHDCLRWIATRDREIAKLKRRVDSLLALIRGVRNSTDAALTMEEE